MIRNIRHIQIKKIKNSPNLLKAIIIFQEENNIWEKRDEIESIKLKELDKINKNNKNKYI